MSWTHRKKAGLSAAVVLAAITMLSACSTHATGATSAGDAPTECPSQSQAVATDEPGAATQQVPFTPNHALACRYQWKLAGSTPSSTTHLRTERTLVGSAVLGARQARNLSSLINHGSVAIPAGTMNCGADLGTTVNIYFTTAGTKWDEVRIAPTGCLNVTNGTLNQYAPSGKVTSTVVDLTS